MKTIDISWRRYIFPNINNEGWRFVGIFAAVTAMLAVLWQPLGWLGLILTVWCYYFFRDPERITPDMPDVVVSPADGTVQMIAKVKAPKELEMGDKSFTRISIFMSVFNVHVNRAPATGKILKSVYVPGKFLNATLDKASKDNERQLLSMKTSSGKEIAFVQIAGLLAYAHGHYYTLGRQLGKFGFSVEKSRLKMMQKMAEIKVEGKESKKGALKKDEKVMQKAARKFSGKSKFERSRPHTPELKPKKKYGNGRGFKKKSRD